MQHVAKINVLEEMFGLFLLCFVFLAWHTPVRLFVYLGQFGFF